MGTIIQETRHFHEDTGSTTSGRVKEEAEDYRYFPEPDLVPVAPSRAWVEEIRGSLPELPLVRRNRLREEWGISGFDMQAILNAGALEPIVATIDAAADAASARKWWMGELARSANESQKALDELAITPEQVARVTELVTKGDLNDKLARQVIEGVLALRGHAGRGRRQAGSEGRLRRGCPRHRRRRGDRRQPRRRGQDPRRQGGRGRRAGRRRHEGHARPGRRRPRQGAHP